MILRSPSNAEPRRTTAKLASTSTRTSCGIELSTILHNEAIRLSQSKASINCSLIIEQNIGRNHAWTIRLVRMSSELLR